MRTIVPLWIFVSVIASALVLAPSFAAAYSCTPLTRDLAAGSVGADVKALQEYLNASADTQIALTGLGSPGNESDTYGPKTVIAVQKWQAKHGLPAVGRFGPASRAKFAEVCSGGTSGGTASVAPPASASSASTPPPTVASSGAIKLDAISPASVPMQEVIHLIGSGFHPTNNVVVFSPTVSVPAASHNGGKLIEVRLPESVTPGIYSLYVQVGNDRSPIQKVQVIGSLSSVLERVTRTIRPGDRISEKIVSPLYGAKAYRLLTSLPTGATYDATTGTFQWATTASVRPGAYIMTFSTVQDATSASDMQYIVEYTVSVEPPQTGSSTTRPRVISLNLGGSSLPSTAALAIECSVSANPVPGGLAVEWKATAPGTGSYQYRWTGTDNLSSSAATAKITYRTLGQKNAQVKVTAGSTTHTRNCTPIYVANFTIGAVQALPQSVDVFVNYSQTGGSTPGTGQILQRGVTTINNPPVANYKDITLRGISSLNRTLTYSIDRNPTHGTVTRIANDIYRYTPTTGYFGADTFTFKVSDGTNTSDPATVSLNVIQREISLLPGITKETSVAGVLEAVQRISGFFQWMFGRTDPTDNLFIQNEQLRVDEYAPGVEDTYQVTDPFE